MFTSRVEYRLLLREDNADIRLREIGYKIGLVSKDEWEKTREKKEKMKEIIRKLKTKKIKIGNKTTTLFEYLKRAGVKISDFDEFKNYPENALFEAEVEVKYSPYIKKHLKEIKEFKNLEKIKIPEDMNYNEIPGLSLEIREKLSKFKPLNLRQASEISGITPSAISFLLVYLHTRSGRPGPEKKDEKHRKIL